MIRRMAANLLDASHAWEQRVIEEYFKDIIFKLSKQALILFTRAPSTDHGT